MSYINETVSSLADFVSKLNTFLTGTPAWTQDEHTPASGKWAVHKTGTGYGIYVSFRWDTSTPNHLGVYQALGYTGGNDPGNHPNDSGSGEISGTDSAIDDERNVPITNTPVQYWCFEDDHYAHVVVETVTGTYAHFGFGQIDKHGDWTGGEYAYGFKPHFIASTNTAVLYPASVLLDGLCKDEGAYQDRELFCGTMHVEGLSDQGGSDKWAVCMGDQLSTALGTDRATNDRVHVTGGFRGGPIARAFGRFNNTGLKGLAPMYPLGMFHWDRTSDNAYFLGFMKDVRGVNIAYYTPASEMTVGSDTWVVFPSYTKYSGSGLLTNTSCYQGIAYKKVTT